eukprot:gene22403-biopygen17738
MRECAAAFPPETPKNTDPSYTCSSVGWHPPPALRPIISRQPPTPRWWGYQNIASLPSPSAAAAATASRCRGPRNIPIDLSGACSRVQIPTLGHPLKGNRSEGPASAAAAHPRVPPLVTGGGTRASRSHNIKATRLRPPSARVPVQPPTCWQLNTGRIHPLRESGGSSNSCWERELDRECLHVWMPACPRIQAPGSLVGLAQRWTTGFLSTRGEGPTGRREKVPQGEGLTGGKVPQGERSHREKGPTGRKVPQGERSHREKGPTGRKVPQGE